MADKKQWYLDAVTQSQDSRTHAERDRDYYDNKQWTSAEIAELNKRKQPVITINRIKPKVDAIIGMEISGRVDIKAFPRTPKDEESAEAATDALRYVADNSDFNQVKSDGAFNLFIEGEMAGIVEVEKKGNTFEIMPRYIPWDRFFKDPHSGRKDGKDAKYMGQAIWMDLDDAVAMFPNADESMLTAEIEDSGDTYDDKPKNVFFQRDRVKVIEMYYNEGGWKHCIFTGAGDLVPGRDSPYLDDEGVPTNPIEMQCAFVDRDNNSYGLVRQLISIQDEINKRRSKALHLLQVRQVMADEGAVASIPDAKRELAKPDGWITRNPGKQMDVLNTSDMATGQFSLMQEAKDEIDAVGANAAVTGKEDRVQSGRALQMRAQSGAVELMPVMDGLRGWEKRMYRQMWCRVKQFWTEEKWVRITDDEKNVKFAALNKPITRGDMLKQAGQPYDVNDPRNQQVVSILNPVAEMDVDIVLEAVPDTVNLQSEQFELLMGMANANPDIIPPEMLIEASSLRNKNRILERMKGGSEEEIAANQEQQQKAAQEAQEMLQLEKANKVAGIKATMAKAARDVAEARATDLETDMAEAGLQELFGG